MGLRELLLGYLMKVRILGLDVYFDVVVSWFVEEYHLFFWVNTGMLIRYDGGHDDRSFLYAHRFSYVAGSCHGAVLPGARCPRPLRFHHP